MVLGVGEMSSTRMHVLLPCRSASAMVRTPHERRLPRRCN